MSSHSLVIVKHCQIFIHVVFLIISFYYDFTYSMSGVIQRENIWILNIFHLPALYCTLISWKNKMSRFTF